MSPATTQVQKYLQVLCEAVSILYFSTLPSSLLTSATTLSVIVGTSVVLRTMLPKTETNFVPQSMAEVLDPLGSGDCVPVRECS